MYVPLLLAYAGLVVIAYLIYMMVFSDYATMCNHILNNKDIASVAILVLAAFVFSSIGVLSVKPMALASAPVL